MKLILRQKIWLTIIVLTNLLLWVIPSDVVEQVARDRHTMLGRYSRSQFSWMAAVAVVSVVGCYIDWSTGVTYKRRWFQVIATVLFLLPALAIADFGLRSKDRSHYIKDSLAYHRPPGAQFRGTYVDQPQAKRTYPNAPGGFPSIECTLSTDARGFRNPTALSKCDVVVLGDSFAEGSNVSDEHAWPAVLGGGSGLSVYNLGMSGYDPLNYLASLREVGLSLHPRCVLCMLYEGNDFRSAKRDDERHSPGWSQAAKVYVKQSPVISALDDALVKAFGPINSRGKAPSLEVLDWLPLAIPPGEGANAYAFAPKQLTDMYRSEDEFALDPRWLNTRRILEDMHAACRQIDCRLIVVLAPTKAHVTMPLMVGRLPADKVRTFTAIDYKKDLPEPNVFLPTLMQRAGARETVVAKWCQRESIPFLGLTAALREAASAGRQVYYTYDQHWTPTGHTVVAQAVLTFLLDQKRPGGPE